MTTVEIDNEPVSEQLAQNESLTVPSGETWNVTIHPEFPGDYGSRGDNTPANININGQELSLDTSGIAADGDAHISLQSTEFVLVADDTVEASEMGISIHGWVIE